MKKFFKYLLIFMVGMTILAGLASVFSDEKPATETTSKEAPKIDVGKKKAGAYMAAKAYIKSKLKAPSTAKFAKYYNNEAKVIYYDNGTATVTMWVDAQNSFGAMVRNTYKVDLKENGDDWQIVNIGKLN